MIPENVLRRFQEWWQRENGFTWSEWSSQQGTLPPSTPPEAFDEGFRQGILAMEERMREFLSQDIDWRDEP